MKRFVVLILATIFLISCAAQLQEVPAVFTPTSMPIVSVTAESVGTPTLSQVSHPASTELVATSDPISLTQDAAIASCAATERTWYTKHLSSTYFTNEQWSAVVCSDNGVYTRVLNASLNINWNVPSFDDDLSSTEPSWYWEPYLWSEDGKYLYLQSVCLCIIDSPWLIYSSGFGLARLDLELGWFKILLVPSDSGHSFEFTEDGNSLAFSPADAYDTIQIRDLMSDTEQNINFQEKYVIVEFRWTPDGSRLVIFTQESAEDESNSGFSVFVYSAKDDTLKKLMEKNRLNSSFPTKEFIEPRIYIFDLSDEVLFLSDIFSENNFELNIRTGELIQVKVMTPAPASQ